MTDRELLEAAAKAAGIAIDYSDTNGGGRFNTGFDILGNAVLDWHNGTTWNPLTDDGDAFRLACKLHIVTRVLGHRVSAVGRTQADEYIDGDVQRAARRAIVRAAAEIGRAGGE